MWKNSIVVTFAMGCLACAEQVTAPDATFLDAFVNVDANPNQGLDTGLLIDANTSPDASAPTDSGMSSDAADATTRTMFVDLIVQLREFHSWNGTNVQVFTRDTLENRFIGPATGTLVEGSADLRIPNGFGRDLFGQLGYLWLDRPGDLMCTDGVDPIYLFNINNDFATGPMIVEVRFSDEPVMVDECGPFTTL